MRNAFFLTVFCVAVLIFAAPAKADGTDPKMIPQSGNAGGCGSTPITLLPFTFSADSSGDSTTAGECFLNSGTQPITSLQVTTTAPPAVQGGPCNSNLYSFGGSPLFADESCTFDPNTQLLTVTFFGTGDNYPGVPVETDFYMDLAGWNADESFTGTANPNLPEPGSLLLLGFGLGALIAVRRGKLATQTL
jgi:hypothetical protein